MRNIRKKKSAVWKSVKYSPDAPEARDEGPRLIPPSPEPMPSLPDHSRYLALADLALGNKFRTNLNLKP